MPDEKKRDFGDYPSSRKAERASARKEIVNRSRKSRINTSVKKVRLADTKENALIALRNAQKELAKGAAKKLLKPNTASRLYSRLVKRVKLMS
jgi:small subunit ribosomal protein S20